MTLELFLALMAIGLVAGLLGGVLGVAGGVVYVPAMVLLLAFDQHIAQGTSLLVVIPAALVGSWTNYRRGRFQLRDAGILAAGGIVGAGIGSFVALGFDDQLLRRLFALLLLVLGIRMLVPPGWIGRLLRLR
ncbi:MAG: TSUP family transporter [Chloroflexota bacterium]